MIARHDGAIRRLLPAVFALALGIAAFVGTARAESGAFYRAELSSPLAAPRTVIDDGLLWRCEGTACVAPRGGSRPAMVCARLARRVGALSRFAMAGGELNGDDLSHCNAAAVQGCARAENRLCRANAPASRPARPPVAADAPAGGGAGS